MHSKFLGVTGISLVSIGTKLPAFQLSRLIPSRTKSPLYLVVALKDCNESRSTYPKTRAVSIGSHSTSWAFLADTEEGFIESHTLRATATGAIGHSIPQTCQ